MARKGHFSFERRQRDLAKAAKREAKREARVAAKLAKDPQEPATPDDAGDEGDGSGTTLPSALTDRRPPA